MQNLNNVIQEGNTLEKYNEDIVVTIFDGLSEPLILSLNRFKKKYIEFGRAADNDIVLTSHLVSAKHGRFVRTNNSWTIEDKEVYKGVQSTNGLIYNNAIIASRRINDGDFIRIDDGIETISEGVLFVFSSSESDNK